jgi:hypothetical protein
MNEYNSETNTRVKTETGAKIRARWACLHYFVNLILLALVVGGLVFFDLVTYNNIIPNISMFAPPQLVPKFLNWETAVYSVYIEIVGAIMSWSIVFFNGKKNYRYKTEYNSNI